MDITDKKILGILATDANTTSIEIGSRVNLSVPAVNKRILKLQNNKIIRSFTILTDAKKVEKPILAYVLIVIRYGKGVKTFLEHVENEPDILECHAVTGEYDYLLKICAKDIESLEEKILHLKQQEGVMKSHTMFSLTEHKFTPTVLPDEMEE